MYVAVLAYEFGTVCEKRNLSVIVGKSKVMRAIRRERLNDLNITLHGIRMEEVERVIFRNDL